MSLPIYDRITQQICAKLEAGTAPWHQPWNATAQGELRNLFSGHVYQGINVLMLGMQGYASPFWCTYEQAKQHKGHVRKGEHGTLIVKVGTYTRDKGTEDEATGQYLKSYTVFNLAQLDGIDAPPTDTLSPLDFTPIERCEKLVGNMPQRPVIRHGSAQAYYSPTPDVVTMPDPITFHSREGYYSTLFHELTHATGHEQRLNRATLKDAVAFGTTNYSKEELVAEMGAAFLCGLCGIENRTIDNSAAYLAGWLRRLRNDQTLLVSAAAQAQRAANFISNREG